MARIRTIKPEFPHSESMGRVSRDARLLFVMLWTLCDDSGRTRGNSRMLASLLFPYDEDAGRLIDGWLDELEGEGCIVRYQAEGSTYLQVCNWLIHQKIDKPSQSKIPAFDESSRILANPREGSSEDQGPRTKDQGRDQGPSEDASHPCDLPVTPEVAQLEIPNRLPCPTEAIVGLYHELMPRNPQCKVLNAARRKAIAARWREASSLAAFPFNGGYSTTADGIERWREFFAICADSDFLTGRTRPPPNRAPFIADVDFLFSPSGFARTLENKYHREVA